LSVSEFLQLNFISEFFSQNIDHVGGCEKYQSDINNLHVVIQDMTTTISSLIIPHDILINFLK